MNSKLFNRSVIFLMFMVCYAIFGFYRDALALPPIEEMEKVTVRLLCVSPEGKVVGTGSGFLVDQGSYVVTNRHVVEGVPKNGGLEVFRLDENTTVEQVIWSSEEKDLAILKLKEKIDTPSPMFAPRKMVKKGSNVYVVGFPGAADEDSDEKFYMTPKITGGVISDIMRSNKQIATYQTDAAINPGNSGGPLFNEMGHIIGINKSKYAAVDVDGVAWAIQIDELIPELEKFGIKVKTPGFPINQVFWGILLACLLGGSAVFFFLFKKIYRGGAITNPIASNPGSNILDGNPVLLCTTGEHKGEKLDLGNQPIVIGRDPKKGCNLMFSSLDISRKHCTVWFDKKENTLKVRDEKSTRGTYLADGTGIGPHQTATVRPGSGFYLCDTKKAAFQLVLNKPSYDEGTRRRANV